MDIHPSGECCSPTNAGVQFPEACCACENVVNQLAVVYCTSTNEDDHFPARYRTSTNLDAQPTAEYCTPTNMDIQCHTELTELTEKNRDLLIFCAFLDFCVQSMVKMAAAQASIAVPPAGK